MLKLSLLAGAAALCAASAASAQAPEGLVGSAASPWAGPYVGVHGGYAWDRDSAVSTTGQGAGAAADLTSLARPGTILRNRDGYVAGGQIGYNVQHGTVVGGVEADFSATDQGMKATSFSQPNTGTAGGLRSDFSARTNYLGSVRGRLGLANDRFMIYGTGGWAYGEVRDRVAFSNAAGGAAAGGVHEYGPTGWVAGAGVEYAIPTGMFSRLGASRVTVRGEYLHYDLKDKAIAVNGGGGGFASRFSNDADVLRGGLNFKF